MGWLGDHVLGTVVGLLVTALVAFGVTEVTGGKPPPLGDQLDAIRERAAHEGMYAVTDRKVPLHGGTSRIIVFRPKAGTEAGIEGASDEVRIYDVVDGRYKNEFQFQAKADPVPYEFAIAGSGRFDATDRQEVVGNLLHVFADTVVPYPVVILWDENLGEYRLRPLLPEEVELPKVKSPGAWGEIAVDRYAGQSIHDTKSATSLRLYGADLFAIRRKPFPILAAAFTLKAACNACSRLLVLKAWKMDFEQPKPAIWSCDYGQGPILRWSPARPLDPVKEWLRLTPVTRRVC